MDAEGSKLERQQRYVSEVSHLWLQPKAANVAILCCLYIDIFCGFASKPACVSLVCINVACCAVTSCLRTWCNPFSSGLSAQGSAKPLVLFTSLSFSHFFGFNLAVEEVPAIASRVPDPVPSSSCTLFRQPPLVFVFLWNFAIRSYNCARVHFILKTHAFRTVFALSYPPKPQSIFVLLRPQGGWKEQACELGLGLNLGLASHWLCDIGQVTYIP